MKPDALRAIARSFPAAVLVAFFATPALGQAILGHEYELEAAPIREGEKAVIPLDVRKTRFFDLRSDPDEKRDLFGSPVSRAAFAELEAWLEADRTPPPLHPELDVKQRELLRSMGYID